ncbi:alpha/beta fold hydrolase [Actinomadura physcomitrii]|uniref:alpha/beta fold hydrolase n=1 Tax=Actinomadura physcomitrii TaxID=2650748 RepID=UPI00136AA78A|nr:alpha/beta fold hydrolase [Actinomadura physcomitrii]
MIRPLARNGGGEVAVHEEGPRVPRWLAVLAGTGGSLLGLATNLYSAEFRRAIAATSEWLSATVLSALLIATVSSGSALAFYRLLARRHGPTELQTGEIPITSDAIQHIHSEGDSVVGRSLRYLETKRDSNDLVIFLHGLGLDYDDFQSYMLESRFHCIALTLFGFNTSERNDDHYKPISLESHLQLLAYALRRFRKDNPHKTITVVGFSFGADALLLLNRYAQDQIRDVRIERTVLLDPNVNRTTTTISSKVAAVNSQDPLPELVDLLHSARDIGELGYLCAYLRKITSKDFGQVRRHAQEVVGVWQGDGYDQFLDRVGQLARIARDVHIILSFAFENQFNGMARAARNRGLDISNLDCSRLGHFDLIGPQFLKERLEGLLYPPQRPTDP